jgi:uroporphyrinogen-III synthase
VRNFFALKLPLPPDLKFASIGPVTSSTLRDCGAEPALEASRHDVEGLVAAICDYCAG